MQNKGRKIVLICDNASCHTLTPEKRHKSIYKKIKTTKRHGLDVQELSNILIVFLPANTTSKVQPLDAGIIAAYKLRYRARQLRWKLAVLTDPNNKKDPAKLKANIRQGIEWTSLIWRQLPVELIQHCWRHVNILPAAWNDRLHESEGRKRRRLAAEAKAAAEAPTPAAAAAATAAPAAAAPAAAAPAAAGPSSSRGTGSSSGSRSQKVPGVTVQVVGMGRCSGLPAFEPWG